MNKLQKIACIIFGALLISISYSTQRHESVPLLAQFTALFGIYIFLSYKKEAFSIKTIILLGIGFRLIFLLLEPNLSEDVYRFIWDGKLWWQGLNAYEWLPTEIIALDNNESLKALFLQLNSPNYYTIYPPINQLIFYFSATADATLTSIIIIRLSILTAEIGTLILLPKVLKQYGFQAQNLIWYAFNPLILLELSGNLHFEAFVIFFLILAIYYYKDSKTYKSALALGFAIAFKLLPLILIAAYFRKITFKKWIQFGLIAGMVLIISLIPILFSDAIKGMLNSSELYFKSFEFNGSIYYLIRAIGFSIKGYNIIAFAGPLMGALSFISIILFNLFAKKAMLLPERMMWTWFIYCLFATTLHPWYCLPLLVLGIMSGYKFPVVWTFLIFFTYIGYTATGFTENLWVTFVEYILLFTYIVFEIMQKRNVPGNAKSSLVLK